MIEVIDHWTDASDKKAPEKNEDAWGLAKFDAATTLWIIDGCTDLDQERSQQLYPNGVTSAHWHKEALTRGLTRTPYDFSVTPRNYLAGILDELQKAHREIVGQHTIENWAYPSSTLIWAALQPNDRTLRLAWIGDSTALLRAPDGTIHLRPPLKEETRDIAPTSLTTSARLEDRIQDYRKRRSDNIRTGRVSLSVFPDRLDHLQTEDIPTAEIDRILLMTDGFSRLMDVFRTLTPQTLFTEIDQNAALRTLGNRLRRLEQQATAQTAQSLAKAHDDATAVLARLTCP